MIIERKNGVEIYGEMIDFKTKRLGRFGVRGKGKDTGGVYNFVSEAQKKMAAEISSHANISLPTKNKRNDNR